MSDLASILAELSAETPRRHDEATQIDLPKPKQWSEADKTQPLMLGLTKFELYHLIWETKYHLSLYQEHEWSETQDAMRSVFPKLIQLWESATSETWWHEIDKPKESES